MIINSLIALYASLMYVIDTLIVHYLCNMSDPHANLLALLHEMVGVGSSEMPFIRTSFEPESCSKGQLLVAAGKIARYMYFINEGYLRLYHLQNGEEVTSHINCPLGFMTSFNSFITQTPSSESFECITDCNLLRISKNDFDDLLRSNQKWAEVGRMVNEQVIVYNDQRTKDIVSLTAEQRYLNIINLRPDLLQNVPLQYIASFIGIKPESLSRIRKKVIS